VEKELRYHVFDKDNLEFRDETRTVAGYAIVYNTESNVLYDEFVEIIEPTALNDVNLNNVYLLYNHNSDNVLASSSSGTLSLRNTVKGLYFSAELPDTNLGRDTYELIKRGDLSNMSFGFVVKTDSWNVIPEPAVRRIKEIEELYEISIVAFPAYSDTDISARAISTLNECKCCKDERDKCSSNLKEAKMILKEVSNEKV
jgi:HK97 family phage prohead protease